MHQVWFTQDKRLVNHAKIEINSFCMVHGVHARLPSMHSALRGIITACLGVCHMETIFSFLNLFGERQHNLVGKQKRQHFKESVLSYFSALKFRCTASDEGQITAAEENILFTTQTKVEGGLLVGLEGNNWVNVPHLQANWQTD